ncbi:MAG: carboxypeptidase-like regulatory domain-containing protein [Flavobacteriaceae bacterium]
MGRKLTLSNIQKFIFSLILYLSVQHLVFSQTLVKGVVTDTLENPVPFANIKLTTDQDFTYVYTDEKGRYELKSTENGQANLEISTMGFQTQVISLELEGKAIIVNVELKDEVTQLDEVIIRTERAFKIKKDTISFKTKFYSDGTEQTVEELLDKIPGLNIDSDGKIKVGNKEIEKLMIDGDDFFEKGYKILSKNMPSHPVEEVEILKNYSNNHLLKDIEESEKVALNLKLDDKSKRIWFGNLEASIGNDSYHQVRTNLMNFGKNNKYYFLGHLNNIGYDATGDINRLTNPRLQNEPGNIGEDAQLGSLLQMSAPNLNFKENRTSFNDAKLISLNAIFNPNEKLKIKPIAFFNHDEIEFYRNRIENVQTNDANFTNTENYSLKNEKTIAFGKIDVIYNISDSQMLESTTKYKDAEYTDASDLVFNGDFTNERLKSPQTEFDQKLKYTHKLDERRVLLLSGRFKDGESPQNYQSNQFFFDDLFPSYANSDAVKQNISSAMQYMGINIHFLNRKENDNLLELQLGNNYKKDKLLSLFSLIEAGEVTNNPSEYQNNTRLKVNDLYLKSKYRYQFKDFAIIGQINFHQYFNEFKDHSAIEDQTPFFINPSLGLDWEINNNNRLRLNYSKNKTNAGILDAYSSYVLTGYRNFSKGVGNLKQLDASNFNVNYELGNWGDRFFASTYFMYSKNHDFFSTNSVVKQDYTQTEKILIKDRYFLNLYTNIDFYVKPISSNIKLSLGYSKSDYENSVNGSDLRKIVSNNYIYGLELRSGFLGSFNFHIGTKWRYNKIKTTFNNSFTDNTSFINLTYVMNDKLDLHVDSERYYFGSVDGDDVYDFLDFRINYKLLKDKINIGLIGKNLFNNEEFTNFTINDIGSTTTQYRLLPRMLLINLKYRF